MAPKIIVVANTKGGVGKTTVALQIATARAIQGKDVWVIDGDRQQTALMALTLRDSTQATIPISCAQYPNPMMLGKEVRKQVDKWDTIVVDIGGYDNAAMRVAMAICDVLIVPYQPRTFDTWALSQMSGLIDEISAQRGGEIPVYAMLNAADSNNSNDNRDAVLALADYENIKYLDCPFGRRKAFATASGFGLNVAELKNKDPKAIAEVEKLMEAIFGDEIDLIEKLKK